MITIHLMVLCSWKILIILYKLKSTISQQSKLAIITAVDPSQTSSVMHKHKEDMIEQSYSYTSKGDEIGM